MINERIQKYVDDHSFCSEYLFKDWEAFLDFIYEEGGRVSSILWWEHGKKNFQYGYGGYSDPDDREWMYSETWFHEDGFEEKSLADIKAYMSEDEQVRLLASDGMLVKRPLLVSGDRVLTGFKEDEWKDALL